MKHALHLQSLPDLTHHPEAGNDRRPNNIPSFPAREAGVASFAHMLPKPPPFPFRVLRENVPDAKPFLKLVHKELEIEGKPFMYDLIERTALDAAVVCAYFVEGGTPWVYLRSAPRVPALVREKPSFDPSLDGVLWELPAGLIEPGESPSVGAARELEEELGFRVAPECLKPLGPAVFPAPGVIGELHVFFEVEVDPNAQGTPGEDGSPLEASAAIVRVKLTDALAACASGLIRDGKTELALRRFAERLSHRATQTP